MRHAPRLLLALALLALGGCGGAPTQVRTVEDPAADDHGPGSYVYPTGPAYVRGAFDLRQVRLEADDRWVWVRVAFARPVPVIEDHRLTRDQRMDLFLPTVDLYFDVDLAPGKGENRALLGRNVRLPPGMGWELAVVLSPIPSRLRQVIGAAPPATSVRVLDRVRVVGDELRGRFPIQALQGKTLDEVAIAVAVTGTAFATTFRTMVPDLVPTAWVREVTEEPGTCDRWDEEANGFPCTFGGCTHCGTHPRVIDALHPDRGAQEEALGDRDPTFGGIAQLPVVLPQGTADQPRAVRETVSLPVTDRRGDVVTLVAGDQPVPEPGTLVEGVDADGQVVVTLVVGASHAGGLLVLRAVDGDAARVVEVRWTIWRPVE